VYRKVLYRVHKVGCDFDSATATVVTLEMTNGSFLMGIVRVPHEGKVSGLFPSYVVETQRENKIVFIALTQAHK